MKPLVKKILESGLVGKHAAKMMEIWGNLDPGSTDLVGQQQLTEKNLQTFLEEVEDLVNGEHDFDLKETRLEMEVSPPTTIFTTRTGNVSAMKDKMGRFIVGPDDVFLIEESLWPDRRSSNHPPARITDVSPIYQGDKKTAQQITVDDSEYTEWLKNPRRSAWLGA